MDEKIIAEYIWLDGNETPMLRSKTKILKVPKGTFDNYNINNLPQWGFDGSSTKQAEGGSSDCVLQPVSYYPDPTRNIPGCKNIIVLNEVRLPDGSPHPSNTRAKLRNVELTNSFHQFMFGIEQEYTLLKDGRPLGFPKDGFPEAQGKYYCGVGADCAHGRKIVEQHMEACLKAGLLFEGINAEVMPGQWEYQIGADDALTVADHLIVARYLMHRIAEEQGVLVTLHPKPQEGDWNGAGAHTNFSTKEMREGTADFTEIVRKLESAHEDHIEIYGEDINRRLTGKHETCSVHEFRHGVSDRGASIRIPGHVHKAGKGYLEDRRPCANIDPYKVLGRIMQTVGS